MTIGNFLHMPVIVYQAVGIEHNGDILYEEQGTELMAKVQVHPTTTTGFEGLSITSSMTVYVEQLCRSQVTVSFDGASHPSKSVTNFYRFGTYAYTRIELE